MLFKSGEEKKMWPKEEITFLYVKLLFALFRQATIWVTSFAHASLTLHLSQLVLIVRLCNWGNAVNDVRVVSFLSYTPSRTSIDVSR